MTTRRSFTQEYRDQAVSLHLDSGRSIAEVAKSMRPRGDLRQVGEKSDGNDRVSTRSVRSKTAHRELTIVTAIDGTEREWSLSAGVGMLSVAGGTLSG